MEPTGSLARCRRFIRPEKVEENSYGCHAILLMVVLAKVAVVIVWPMETWRQNGENE
jgi:hypothetical protein